MIECRNIRKTYQNEGGNTEVLKGISFVIADGEFVSIMGPSGSGKSTLMHILGALDASTSGEYLLNNRDISQCSD
ncbi:MAG: putative transport system ATP-binding protein, partial [Patescibacteria group bacterium]|nr:putative transport system ATP-binding protein [Patescibacteria group bacterium]